MATAARPFGLSPSLMRTARATIARPSAYWHGTLYVAFAVLTIIAFRVHELVPYIRFVKPALLTMLFGIVPMVLNTRGPAYRAALREPLMIAFIAYAFWCGVTILFSDHQGRAFATWKIFTIALQILAGLLLLRPTRQNLDRVTLAFVAALSALSALTILRGQAQTGGRLTTGGTMDPNDLAAVLAFGVPVGFMLARRKGAPWYVRIGALAGVGVMILCILKTGSRGGFLALTLGIIGVGLGLGVGRGLRVLALAAVTAVAVWPIAPPQFKSRIVTLNNLEEDYNTTSSSGRKEVARRGLRYFAASPIFGGGVGTFVEVDGRFLQATGQGGKWSAAHNTYVQALADTGLPGALAFVSMLLITLRQAFRFWRPPARGRGDPYFHRPELLAAVLGFSFAAYFLSHAYFYPMFGLLAYVAFVRRVWLAEQLQGAASPHVPAAGAFPTARRVLQRGGLALAPGDDRHGARPYPA